MDADVIIKVTMTEGCPMFDPPFGFGAMAAIAVTAATAATAATVATAKSNDVSEYLSTL